MAEPANAVAAKDVITTLIGAAGGTAAFGLAFVATVVALHGTKGSPKLQARLSLLMKFAGVAFILSMVSTALAFFWLALSASSSEFGALPYLYIGSVASFVVGIAILVIVLIIFAVLLRKEDLFKLAADAVARFAQLMK